MLIIPPVTLYTFSQLMLCLRLGQTEVFGHSQIASNGEVVTKYPYLDGEHYTRCLQALSLKLAQLKRVEDGTPYSIEEQ